MVKQIFPFPPHTVFSKALLYFCVNIPDSIWKRLSVPVSFNEILRGLKYKILLTDKTSSFLPSITNSITIRFQHKYYPVFFGHFRALSHRIFGNFIFLCWLWAFKLQLEEKDLFSWQNCHLHTTDWWFPMSHFRTTWNKLVLQIYLNAISCSVLPSRVPFFLVILER